ncbi:hypothetical protein K488DRAFT_70391 [Vararia minispora EC-137]|uniref:Uncharacterized protein n=1 Tax=Vararia minispora EC-137 TaxID=1314806 RepID=A0ACB8QM53_9AGAM|nr:hypothetical protein K488DRAFT_70391 [Vararia minispora EC-137]
MPRRPRPTSRRRPSSRDKAWSHSALPSKPRADSTSDSDSDSDDCGEGPSSLARTTHTEQDRDDSGWMDVDEDLDVDKPRVSLWRDEVGMEGEEGASEDDGASMQNGLHSLPLGALAKAQRALAQTAAGSDSDENEHSSSGGENGNEKPPGPPDLQSSHERPQKKPITKRVNKHAPQEITSKRPVSRHRQVVEIQKLEPRDPRFIPMTGPLDASKFRAQYSFLSEFHLQELSTLRDNLKRARKLLASSPRDLRAEREAEVERLERAYKRAESTVSRDKREKIEQDALEKAKKEEKEKRKQGKGVFYLKNSEKKRLLLKARYDALAAEGGKRAVKKAIQKKQKKVSQKETRSRPFARGGDGSASQKRPRDAAAAGAHTPNKRRRLS